MNINKKITDRLTLMSSDTHRRDEDENIVSIRLWFEFYEEECNAILTKKDVESDRPNYKEIESPSDIHASFTESIEDEENFEIIKQSFYDHLKLDEI